MKKFHSTTVLLLLSVLFFAGCSGKSGKKTEVSEAHESTAAAAVTEVQIDNETLLLIKDLADNGDYVNSREFPSLIKASVVYESMGANMHIIDLRAPLLYSQGHIKGSVNKRFEELPEYFESGIKPFELDKIILVCEDGQISSYATSLLRLMGYGNVYAMRWGMSAWNARLAEAGWLKGLSAKYEQNLEKTIHEKPVPLGMPVMNTGLSQGDEISAVRFKSLFAEGTGNVLIEADEVFKDPRSYFVINYERKDKYDDAHTFPEPCAINPMPLWDLLLKCQQYQ